MFKNISWLSCFTDALGSRRPSVDGVHEFHSANKSPDTFMRESTTTTAATPAERHLVLRAAATAASGRLAHDMFTVGSQLIDECNKCHTRPAASATRRRVSPFDDEQFHKWV
jgi:hypothetical protein